MQRVEGLSYKDYNLKIVRLSKSLSETQIDYSRYTKLFTVTAAARFSDNICLNASRHS
jgi:hypothetical protein